MAELLIGAAAMLAFGAFSYKEHTQPDINTQSRRTARYTPYNPNHLKKTDIHDASTPDNASAVTSPSAQPIVSRKPRDIDTETYRPVDAKTYIPENEQV